MQLLDFCRSQGVTMGSLHRGWHIGWTVDEAAAEACRSQGATVLAGYNSQGPRGWEISFISDAERERLAEIAAREREDTQSTKGPEA